MTPQTTVAVPNSAPETWQWTESNNAVLGTFYSAVTLAPSGITCLATVYKIADGWAYSIDEGTDDEVVDQIVESVEPFATPDEAKAHLSRWSKYLIAEYTAAGIEIDVGANNREMHFQWAVPHLDLSPIPNASDLADPFRWHVLSPICALRFSTAGDKTLRLLITESSAEIETRYLYRWQWSIDVETGVDVPAVAPLASGFARTAYAARQLAMAAAAAYHSTPDALRR